MTDEEIIKALENKINGSDYQCFEYNDILDLIVRQQAEIKRLTYTLLGVMHSVDKWLDGAELEQDEVNRAATMREKTLRIAEEKQTEIKRLENEVKLLTQNSITEKFPHCVLCGNGAILTKSLEDYDKIIADISSEAIKEFAERLKKHSRKMQSSDFSGDFWDAAVLVEDIDNLVKEMVGDTE